MFPVVAPAIFVEKNIMTTLFNFNRTILFKKMLPMALHCLLACCIHSNSYAQVFENLMQLNGHQTQVFYSNGAVAKAERLATQLDGVLSFYNKQMEFTPSVTLLILSPADWEKYARSVVYGMPHYTNSRTLIVAADNNEFWKSFNPQTDKMPPAFAKLIKETYADEKGGLTMEPFFDLLAIHELGHAYQNQDSLKMQRHWMGELFSNILLHSYIAENEPQLLNALTVFPKIVVANTEKAALKYTSLQDLETHYDETAQQYPRNYGWYQCRWHMAASNIYDKGGLDAFKKLWLALKTQRTILDDSSLATLLAEKAHESVADVLLKWDEVK